METEKKRIWLSSPTTHGDEQRLVQEAFDTNWIAPLGPHVDAFEEEMAAYLMLNSDRKLYAAALSSGTAALHLAVKLAGIGQGDVVLAQSLTFAASVNPVVYENATPVFIDSEPDTWNMSPDALRAALKKYPQAKAVIPVHLYGTPAKLDALTAICRDHGVTMIEDAAEALGGTFRGRQLGTFGDFGVLSFNGNKIITTSSGGMLVSSDAAEIARTRFLATQARDPAPHYQHSSIGYNYRMSNVLAGIGRGQFRHLQEHLAKKKAIYERYREAFADLDVLSMNPMNPDGEANYWLSCFTLSGTDVRPYAIMDALARENIESRPIWKPMHLQPVYEDCDFFADPYAEEKGVESVCGDIFENGLCLPSDIKNTEEDMERIIGVVRGMLG